MPFPHYADLSDGIVVRFHLFCDLVFSDASDGHIRVHSYYLCLVLCDTEKW